MTKKIALSIVILLLSCFDRTTLQTRCEISQKPLKVGFILVEARSDHGWNYAHDQGRIYLEKHMPGEVQTTVVENVPESAEVERVMERMIAQGNKLIFATSYGYLESALKVAARHPDVIILYIGRPNVQPMKNVGTYVASQNDTNYAVGIVAGRMTKKNEIGYVGAHPVPPLLACLNAFTLGARSVNPKVKVHMVWTNSWHDPVLETEAAKSLIDQGVDVLFSHADSCIAVVTVAEKNNVYSIGTHADLAYLAPNGWLTGTKWNWGPLYVDFVRSILNHTWKAGNNRYEPKDECIQLSSFGSAVPVAVQKEASSAFEKTKGGKFIVFKGPIKDREGTIKIPNGKMADSNCLETMDWVVAGIEGSIPKQ